MKHTQYKPYATILLFSLSIILSIIIVGCTTSQNTPTQNQNVQISDQNNPQPEQNASNGPQTTTGNQNTQGSDYHPTFSIINSGCDKTDVYLVLNISGDYSGNSQLKILDTSSSLYPVTATKLNAVDLKSGQENKLVLEHGQQVTSRLDYEFCIAGDCKQEYCTVDNCLQYSDVLVCSARQECTMKDSLCQNFVCNSLKNQSDCESLPQRCQWVVNARDNTTYCQLKGCPLHYSKDDCDQGYDCQWLGNVCITFSCTSLSTESICNSDPRCTWKASEYGASTCDVKTV